MKSRAVIGIGLMVLCLLSAGAALARRLTFSAVRGSYAAAPRFRVTYLGTGEWSTVYHSTPANPGGNPDTNDAHDSSSQRWNLRFLEPLSWRVLPAAGFSLSGATGATRVTGRIVHSHLDGLYPADDTSVNCRVAAAARVHRRLPVTIELVPVPARRSLRLTAFDPVGEALTLLPQQCPGQGDSLDGLADNYFTPGFSFAPGYGPGRWFRSRSVLIPLAVLQRTITVTIHLGPALNAAPPPDCAVPNPSWQRCRAGGAWQGTLRLQRLG